MDRLYIPEPSPKPFAPLVDAFVTHLQQERELSSATTANYQWHVQRFLTDFNARQSSFAEIGVEDTDVFLARQGAHWCRVSIASSAKALRAFFRYAEDQGWCRTGIASAIESPRLFRNETLPLGPAWEDLQQLIPAADSQRPRNIRDRAILLLFARCARIVGAGRSSSAFTRVTACTLAGSPKAIRYIEGFSHFVASMTAPIASGWSKIAGWDLHPLRNAAFARRTPIPDQNPAGIELHIRIG